jgi:hypothetical protein
VKIIGIEKSIQNMQTRVNNFRGNPAALYNGISQDMLAAIDSNADQSYTDKSPAKRAAKNSVNNWTHSEEKHTLNIDSKMYANYRQYGCGGLTIAKLVEVLQTDIDKMKTRFEGAFHLR